MTIKMGLLKQAAFAVCCAAGLGAVPLAHADSFGVSVATGPGYYNGGYYNRGYHPQRCFRDYYGMVHCRVIRRAAYYPVAAYGTGPVYYGGAPYNGTPAYYSGAGYYGGTGYYNGATYGSGLSLSYYGGSNHRDHDRDGWRDRDHGRPEWNDHDRRDDRGDRDQRGDRDDDGDRRSH